MLKFGNTYLNFGGTCLTGWKPNYNPLNLPPNTIRAKFKAGYNPTIGATQTLVDSVENIWDICTVNNSWFILFKDCHDLLEILGANASNVTDMRYMFYDCTSLTSVALFDTSNVTNMDSMFSNCTSLKNVPLFDTSNVTNMFSMLESCESLTSVPLFDTSKATTMAYMFNSCTNVQSGALALYQQASTQTTPPTNHSKTFHDCGYYTQTGREELNQIPSDWK